MGVSDLESNGEEAWQMYVVVSIAWNWCHHPLLIWSCGVVIARREGSQNLLLIIVKSVIASRSGRRCMLAEYYIIIIREEEWCALRSAIHIFYAVRSWAAL